jgi:hypothetical protein
MTGLIQEICEQCINQWVVSGSSDPDDKWNSNDEREWSTNGRISCPYADGWLEVDLLPPNECIYSAEHSVLQG